MEGETREKKKKMVETLQYIMKGGTGSTEVKKKIGILDGMIILTITCASEMWAWNERQRLRNQVY